VLLTFRNLSIRLERKAGSLNALEAVRNTQKGGEKNECYKGMPSKMMPGYA